ncbi:hypothetical protein TRFO_25913 [Tritrichomonas foetus]|uniref:Uncharacterized protein n=1 Tax=Tritrichomonas foetus TaxID=1144522 RepID=A0A1J4K8Y1_9EUKA|nr:hypothetical protein TRFO_25913 [Tritrichomonas foetus]|eukprot:OHT06134.1 hypothetical protein TRFO_25913 [Tritrichomonas foetus]
MTQKTDSILQDSAFYTRRYILSACMNWNDCIFLRSDGSKANSWKKAQQTKIRIDPASWQVELALTGSKEKSKWEKSQIQNVTIDETKDSENKTHFVQLTMGKNDILSISSHKDFVNLFYCGVTYLIEKEREIKNHPLIVAKKQEFDTMISNMKDFLSGPSNDSIPPVPPLPPNLDFVEPPPQNPT